MAIYKLLPPFIRPQEGGLSRNIDDDASKNPCPYPFKGEIDWHTNAGITWSTWSSVYGISQESADRFFTMSEEDWDSICKPLYWDAMSADDIKSQRIGNTLVDWGWGSGRKYPVLDIQKILDTVFNDGLEEDGQIGPKTIAAINSADEPTLYNSLVAAHQKFLNDILAEHPQWEVFRHDWFSRVQALVEYNKQFA